MGNNFPKISDAIYFLGILQKSMAPAQNTSYIFQKFRVTKS